MNVPAKINNTTDIMEQVIIKGDLARLTPEERVRYYGEVCRSIGLNPLTKPFEFISLNGKLVLYATRTCGDQLRKINGVSLEIVSRVVADDVMTIHVRARMPDGRCDEDYGAVSYPSTLKGEVRANAELKCVTKAKRRATLSICGLGWLDETEIDDIPKYQTAKARVKAIAELPEAEREAAAEDMHEQDSERMAENFGNAIDARPGAATEEEMARAKHAFLMKGRKTPLPDHDEHGEVWDEDRVRPATPEDFESPPAPSRPAMAAALPQTGPTGGGAAVLSETETLARFDQDLAAAAEAGTAALAAEWKEIPIRYRAALMAAKDRRHKPRAAEIDRAGT
jgi:hypothetical protein